MTPGEIVSRRICWPNPDATCLAGGCIYCNDYPFKSLRIIGGYAKGAGVLSHRAHGEQDAMQAFQHGQRHEFFNAETRRQDTRDTGQ